MQLKVCSIALVAFVAGFVRKSAKIPSRPTVGFISYLHFVKTSQDNHERTLHIAKELGRKFFRVEVSLGLNA